jgi:hypothetical protein
MSLAGIWSDFVAVGYRIKVKLVVAAPPDFSSSSPSFSRSSYAAILTQIPPSFLLNALPFC